MAYQCLVTLQHIVGGRRADAAQRYGISNKVLDQLSRISSRYGLVAVGTPLTGRPPHRSVRAEFPHTAPASGDNGENACQARGG
ncbi:MAG: hypothetical protein ACR2RB_09630, partial [Gammaproteobacteria bacterium]